MQQAKWEESVCRFMEQEDLIHPGDGVLVGVSGGGRFCGALTLSMADA